MRGLVLLVSVGIAACGSGGDSSNQAGGDEEVYRESKQYAWNEQGKEAIKTKLKDPDSAQFRNVQFHAGIAPVTCGEVNAKNSFGGYSGYERFIAGGDVITVLESEMADGEMDKAWAQICIG